jgi:hypothetical protein
MLKLFPSCPELSLLRGRRARTPQHHRALHAGLGAAVIAVAALVLAANVGPARAEEPTPVQGQHVAGITDGAAASDTRVP